MNASIKFREHELTEIMSQLSIMCATLKLQCNKDSKNNLCTEEQCYYCKYNQERGQDDTLINKIRDQYINRAFDAIYDALKDGATLDEKREGEFSAHSLHRLASGSSEGETKALSNKIIKIVMDFCINNIDEMINNRETFDGYKIYNNIRFIELLSGSANAKRIFDQIKRLNFEP